MLIVVLAMRFERLRLTSKLWLLLQHVLLVRGGQFGPESPGQLPAESLVSLQRNGVVNFTGISNYTSIQNHQLKATFKLQPLVEI
jgi:hypothetical protein